MESVAQQLLFHKRGHTQQSIRKASQHRRLHQNRQQQLDINETHRLHLRLIQALEEEDNQGTHLISCLYGLAQMSNLDNMGHVFDDHRILDRVLQLLQSRQAVGEYESLMGWLGWVAHLLVHQLCFGKVLEWLMKEYPYMDVHYQAQLVSTLNQVVHLDRRYLDTLDHTHLIDHLLLLDSPDSHLAHQSLLLIQTYSELYILSPQAIQRLLPYSLDHQGLVRTIQLVHRLLDHQTDSCMLVYSLLDQHHITPQLCFTPGVSTNNLAIINLFQQYFMLGHHHSSLDQFFHHHLTKFHQQLCALLQCSEPSLHFQSLDFLLSFLQSPLSNHHPILSPSLVNYVIAKTISPNTMVQENVLLIITELLQDDTYQNEVLEGDVVMALSDILREGQSVEMVCLAIDLLQSMLHLTHHLSLQDDSPHHSLLLHRCRQEQVGESLSYVHRRLSLPEPSLAKVDLVLDQYPDCL